MSKYFLAMFLVILFHSCTPKTIDLNNNRQVYEVEKAIVKGDTVIFINVDCQCRDIYHNRGLYYDHNRDMLRYGIK